MGNPKFRNPGGAPLSQDEWHIVLRGVIVRATKAEAEADRLRRAIDAVKVAIDSRSPAALDMAKAIIDATLTKKE